MSIATFIKQDLIANIRSGEIDSDRLTLDALSKRYQVSTKPVRTAVQELIEEKYLEKGENGRLAITLQISWAATQRLRRGSPLTGAT